jgi:hypothetical protein
MTTCLKNGLKTLKASAFLLLATLALVHTASAQANSDQMAIQLGAIQLGYNSSTNTAWSSTNTQLIANALTQGRLAMAATTTNPYAFVTNNGGTNYQYGSTNMPPAQSGYFKMQVYNSTLFALSSPVTYTNSITPQNVVVTNPVSHTVSTSTISTFGFTPQATTPSAILSLATARVPDMSPGLISNAVAASMKYTTNSKGVILPLFGPQPSASSISSAGTNPTLIYQLNQRTAATLLSNAQRSASTAMVAALAYYPNGTQQWVGINTAGVAKQNMYLPNFSTTLLGSSNNTQAPNLTGIANAASAVAANAINGLGAFNLATNASTANLFGKTSNNVQALTQQLVAVVASYQTISTSTVKINNQTYSGFSVNGMEEGALGAASFGLVTQVAGTNASNWNTAANKSLLNAVVAGAVQASPVNVPAIAIGVAQGFYATYLKTAVGTPISEALFISNNTSAITTSFLNAHASTSYNGITLSNTIVSAFQDLYTKYTNGNFAAIAGAKGVNMSTNNLGVLNGIGTPVTDTIGL